jgi:hypothetical protein
VTVEWDKPATWDDVNIVTEKTKIWQRKEQT